MLELLAAFVHTLEFLRPWLNEETWGSFAIVIKVAGIILGVTGAWLVLQVSTWLLGHLLLIIHKGMMATKAWAAKTSWDLLKGISRLASRLLAKAFVGARRAERKLKAKTVG
jgi:hypothetical protein